MTAGLERRYGRDNYHFVTFSCYQRRPYFSEPSSRDIFEWALEATRRKYKFVIDAYVVMPEHIHLLVSEPEHKTLSVALQALKVSVSQRLEQTPFWQRRFYDFNVFSDGKWIDKRRYIHRNPFTRGLVAHPKDWKWSSYRQWAYGEVGVVTVETMHTAAERMRERTERESSRFPSA